MVLGNSLQYSLGGNYPEKKAFFPGMSVSLSCSRIFVKGRLNDLFNF